MASSQSKTEYAKKIASKIGNKTSQRVAASVTRKVMHSTVGKIPVAGRILGRHP